MLQYVLDTLPLMTVVLALLMVRLAPRRATVLPWLGRLDLAWCGALRQAGGIRPRPEHRVAAFRRVGYGVDRVGRAPTAQGYAVSAMARLGCMDPGAAGQRGSADRFHLLPLVRRRVSRSGVVFGQPTAQHHPRGAESCDARRLLAGRRCDPGDAVDGGPRAPAGGRAARPSRAPDADSDRRRGRDGGRVARYGGRAGRAGPRVAAFFKSGADGANRSARIPCR